MPATVRACEGASKKRAAVVLAAAAGEEEATRGGRAAVERHVSHRDRGRHVKQASREVSQASRGEHHRSAAVRIPCAAAAASLSGTARTGSSGATASSRNAWPTTAENTGAATSPPMYLPALGSSMTTTAARRGLLEGAMPPNTAM